MRVKVKNEKDSRVEKPIHRSALRIKLDTLYYGVRRYRMWFGMRRQFAREKSTEPLPYQYFSHKTLLLRKLKDVDMWMQYNKITNLKLAAARLNGMILHPGEVFSYWRLIGMPTRIKGYKKGMILRNGRCEAGVGGGLCQLSNLIFWMTIHTPLTVIERHRHGYDVFPDSNHTQPFASGATCSYPHIDLMIRNDTESDYQLFVYVGDEYLHGEWRVSDKPELRFEIVERNHEMRAEYWGGYTRRNEIYQLIYDSAGELIEDRLLIKNAAIMMYTPFLEESSPSAVGAEKNQDESGEATQ